MHNVGPSIKKKRKVAGFAMIISLALISFVFLLVITLVSQVRQDLAYSDARQNHILAKAHARMGMMIAIGEIQKHLGPDMRVSTTADIYDERLESGKKHYPVASNQEYGYGDLHDQRIGGYPSPTPNIDNFYREDELVNLYDSNDVKKLPLGQRQWTGVWAHRSGHSESSLPIPPLPRNRDIAITFNKSWMPDSEYDHHPAIEKAWLVSGNEGWQRKLAIWKKGRTIDFIEVPDGLPRDDGGKRYLNDPEGETYGNYENAWMDHLDVVRELNASSNYHHPLLALPYYFENSGQSAWLLKSPVLSQAYDPNNSVHVKNWKDYLVAEPVKVPKTALHLHQDQRDDDPLQDWQTRFGGYAYWVGDEGVKAKLGVFSPLLDVESKLKISTKPNFNRGSFGFDYNDDRNLLTKRLYSPHDSKSLINEGSLSDVPSTNYFHHSITTNSYGLLTDSRTGGLKRDLSLAFSEYYKDKYENKESSSWKNDFNQNFIFRDRVEARKNFPLKPDAKRNQWYVEATNPVVLDDDALLAGPSWSVLADYHNLYKKYGEVLKVDPPDEFPRIVGDNLLIFDRKGPQSHPDSPNKFKNPRDALPYYNCFPYPLRAIRPEPQNHSIFPVITGFKFSMCPVIDPDDTEKSFALSFNPNVTVWNPYNKPMQLEHLFLKVPLETAITFRITRTNLKEYDLYRKWWAYLYSDSSESENVFDEFIKSLERIDYDKSGIIKNWDEPWSLFEHFSEDSDNLEPGLLIALRKGWSMGREGDLSADLRDPLSLDWPSPGFTENWKNNLMPESHYAPYLWGDRLRHENPREGIADYFFRFYSLSKRNDAENSVSFDTFYCKLNPYTLGAGETVTFAVLEKETALIPATDPKIPFISLSAQSDQQEETFLWRSTDETLKLRDNFIGYSYGVNGVKGMKEGDGEVLRYNAQTRQITRSKDTFFDEPNSVTMYYQELGDGDEFSPQNAQRVYQVTDNFYAHFQDSQRMKYATTSILEENLVRRDQTDVLPGIGWEINWLMLGDSMCDRVILNDFNFRAHVSSSQHGSGNNIKTPDPKENIRTLSPLHLGNTGQALRTPDFDLSHCAEELSYGVNTFKFPHGKLYQSGHSDEGYLSKRFPDVYGLPASFDAENFERNIREFNREEDPDQRANLLGFSNNGKDPMDYIIVENPNIDNQIVPRADSSKLSVGFFNRTNYNSNQYSNIKPSTEGVLFDVPMSSPLSLFQYRHANLNNYLHGPNYALGNAYATTQVARHRSWGRVQLVVKKPHSKGGMNSVKKNLEVRDEYLAQVVNKNPRAEPDELYSDITYFGHSEIANWDDPGFGIDGYENIDRDQGFADWRAKGANQFNHQNTTVDHSYYLNRSLLDGFFLSGMDSDHCVNEGSLPLGEHYRPFIFNASSTSTSLDRDSTKEAKGNHRLMGYVRKYPNGNWKTNRTVYNINNTNETKPYRYQTNASDLILDGSFNVNSTSVDAWIAQLSSLRGISVPNGPTSINSTPVVRFLEEPLASDDNNWNELRSLSDTEIASLAKNIVKQVKLRGPFLSFSDFVNRRLIPGPADPNAKTSGSRPTFILKPLKDWEKIPEDKFSMSGLRGTVQHAIAESGLNTPSGVTPLSFSNPIPEKRYIGDKFRDFKFGLHALSEQEFLDPKQKFKNDALDGVTEQIRSHNVEFDDGTITQIKDDLDIYGSTKFGEAPENILAVENLATGANKPGWVMQSDILSPLAPVSAARSDTFTIRVLGETSSSNTARAWIELVVQRTPDYIKPDLDPPHHRPHEPHKDLNLNGYWDDSGKLNEQWLDLNRNGELVARPDLPGVGESGRLRDYRDGLLSDLPLSIDPQEEDGALKGISIKGINQRFGRKFKIIQFRWLRSQDV